MSDIGISTSCFYPLETEKSLEKVCLMGFKTVEIFINAYCELEEPYVSLYKKFADEYGLNVVSIHTTASVADGYNYFSDYYRRFEESIVVFKKYISLAKTLDSKYIIIHGVKKVMRTSDELYFERFKELSELAYQNGLYLLQENVNSFRSESPEYIERMRKAVGESFGITLDIKQCRRAGVFIEKHHDIIKHIHISDSDGSGDYRKNSDCVTPLKGLFDFNKLFTEMKKYGYDGEYIIELYKHSFNDENELTEAGRKLKVILERAD